MRSPLISSTGSIQLGPNAALPADPDEEPDADVPVGWTAVATVGRPEKTLHVKMSPLIGLLRLSGLLEIDLMLDVGKALRG